MKKFLGFLCLSAALLLTACGGSSERPAHKFAGTFTDEFDNKFVLNEDYTATIQFAGSDNIVETAWHDGVNHNSPFATIEYNGDPTYYYLRDGFLYRRQEDMANGTCAIVIKYEE